MMAIKWPTALLLLLAVAAAAQDSLPVHDVEDDGEEEVVELCEAARKGDEDGMEGLLEEDDADVNQVRHGEA